MAICNATGPSGLETPSTALLQTETQAAAEGQGALGPVERMNLVVVGHVDHGKSTVVGRLLFDTDSLPHGKLEQVQAKCNATGKRFEYAFLLDALMDEQAQGITIDTARIFFRTSRRHYIILDAPGHIEFLRNMITGASHAEAALLVIDAEEGVQENSRRHGYMLSMLGVKHVIVLINKMDLVDYSRSVYESLVQEYSRFLARLGTTAESYIPISGFHGENIARPSEAMSWYTGPTVLGALDALTPRAAEHTGALRMYVQDVYKFTKFGDNRRMIVGTIDCGSLRTGDSVMFLPSGKRTRVASIEAFNAPPTNAAASGEAVGITMSEQIYASRGELMTRVGDVVPSVSTRAQVSLFWLGREPLTLTDEFSVKIGTAKVRASLESITKIVDAGDLSQSEAPQSIGRNNVAECVLRFAKPLAFDTSDFLSATGRFVVVKDHRIWGGGIIRQALPDRLGDVREQVRARDQRWMKSLVSPIERAERYAQRPCLLLVTGRSGTPRPELARAVEAQLFREGRAVYFLGMGNVLRGLDRDIEGQANIGQEHIRRVAELGNIMLDAGFIFIVSAADLTRDDIMLVQELVGSHPMKVALLGDESDIPSDVQLSPHIDISEGVASVKSMLAAEGVIFRPF